MGLLKHTIPKPIRRDIVERVDTALPDGLLRKNLANAITVGGAVLVGVGAKVDGKAGLILRAVGEACDDFDGDTSRALGISSKFGALLDVILDKIKMKKELGVLWRHTHEMSLIEGTVRRTALGIITAKHLANASINALAFVSGVETGSSFMGQVNLWVDGATVASFGLSDVTKPGSEVSRRSEITGYALTAIGVPIGAAATFGYYKNFRDGLVERATMAEQLANNTTAVGLPEPV